MSTLWYINRIQVYTEMNSYKKLLNITILVEEKKTPKNLEVKRKK